MKVFIPILFSVTLLFACTNQREELIKGSWQKIESKEMDVITYWEFDNQNNVYKIVYSGNGIDTIGQGNYIIKNKVLTIAGNSNMPYFYGDWEIHKLNDEVMVLLFTDSGLEYYEFLKD